MKLQRILREMTKKWNTIRLLNDGLRVFQLGVKHIFDLWIWTWVVVME